MCKLVYYYVHDSAISSDGTVMRITIAIIYYYNRETWSLTLRLLCKTLFGEYCMTSLWSMLPNCYYLHIGATSTALGLTQFRKMCSSATIHMHIIAIKQSKERCTLTIDGR